MYHPQCIGLARGYNPPGDWYCPSCACGACGVYVPPGEESIVCGSEDGSAGCERVWHLRCAGLTRRTVPAGDWFCAQCKAKGAGSGGGAGAGIGRRR